MITIEQIKAARGLLDWNQEDLAEHAALSKAAINKLERRIVTPRAETLRKIQDAMEVAGVEFTEGPGVRLRGDVFQVRIFEGQDAIFRLFEDMVQTLKKGEGMLCDGVDERRFVAAGEERFNHYLDKWLRLGIDACILIKHGDDYFVDVKEHYRWLPEEKLSNVPYFVYGTKYAILLWEPIQRIVLIENKAIADSYRAQFMQLWEDAAVPPEYVKTSYHFARKKEKK